MPDDQESGKSAVPVRGMHRRTRIWRRTQWTLIAFLILILVAAAAVWVARKPIANNVLASELRKRGVQANFLCKWGGHTINVHIDVKG